MTNLMVSILLRQYVEKACAGLYAIGVGVLEKIPLCFSCLVHIFKIYTRTTPETKSPYAPQRSQQMCLQQTHKVRITVTAPNAMKHVVHPRTSNNLSHRRVLIHYTTHVTREHVR